MTIRFQTRGFLLGLQNALLPDPNGRVVQDWQDAQFSGGASFQQNAAPNAQVRCFFFPKNTTESIRSKIDQVESNLSAIEVLIERYVDSDAAEAMADIRCEVIQDLINVLTPEESPACLQYEERPGFKWVPKDDVDESG